MQVTQQSDWSVKEAAGVRLGDKRFERVVAEVLEAQFNQNGRSFSGACGNALRQAAGRMLRRRKVTPMHLLAGHQQATLERCMDEKLIVVSQDSSSYNYSGHLSTSGLGSINDMKHVSGIHQHSALAMTEGAVPLGVVHAKFWVRTGKKKSQWQRLKELLIEKESYKWLETSERLQELFAPYFAAQGRVILVGDREADIFDVFAAPRHEQLDLLVRTSRDRNVVLKESGQAHSLFECIAAAPLLGEYELDITARPGRAARCARMQLRSAEMLFKPPTNGVGHVKQQCRVWVVQATEILPEDTDVKPLEWTLTTTLEAADMQAAMRVVKLYTCRWEIERLHYTIKSGCNAERLQMDDADTLCNTLALYMIVAWRLLFITRLGRSDPDEPALAVVDETELAVLRQDSGKSIVTVAQVLVAVAKMAGYEPYKNGPPPGVKTIWLGLRRLESMAAGWKLAMQAVSLQKM